MKPGWTTHPGPDATDLRETNQIMTLTWSGTAAKIVSMDQLIRNINFFKKKILKNKNLE